MSRQQPVATPAKGPKGLDPSKPPLSSLEEIFADLTEAALKRGLRDALRYLRGSPIKVATMCSGTESPILACRLIAEACAERGEAFAFEHMFSAEIVPFKQAFIERNFSPPLIFRNVEDLRLGEKSETAYGAPAELPEPGQVQILVAGFACVDFSQLNTKRRELEFEEQPTERANARAGGVLVEGGESSATFAAIARYAKDYRPPVIILENIRNAPWDGIRDFFGSHGYAAEHIALDTKQYYLPHTRQRGYMICLDRAQAEKTGGDASATLMAKEWRQVICSLARPASSPVEDFLLPEHSPELQKALEDFIEDEGLADSVKAEVDWTVCQGRHMRYRASERIGPKTPYTNWKSGKSTFPSYANVAWGRSQPNRVKDTLDILKLRNARKGIDFEFKSRFVDLSQNVDRGLGNSPQGITGCLTPSGQIFSTVLGRPLVGIESLSLQGLPVDRLLLTRETQKELKDLAGNAMTSTVVGSAILAALIVAHKTLSVPKDREMKSQEPEPTSLLPLPQEEVKLNFGSLIGRSFRELMNIARLTRQLCVCEGQSQVSQMPVYSCELCGATACEKCKTIPKHSYKKIFAPKSSMLAPTIFNKAVIETLPTRFYTGLQKAHFEQALETVLRSEESLLNDESQETLQVFLDAIGAGLSEELRFQSILRGPVWKVTFESLRSRLEIRFEDLKVTCFLFCKPESSALSRSLVRQILNRPVAQMEFENDKASDISQGAWKICLPIDTTMEFEISGSGYKLPSWKKELGLLDLSPAEETVWSHLKLSPVGSDFKQGFDIGGEYQLLPCCGTATRALHKRVSNLLGRPCNGLTKFLFFDVSFDAFSKDDKFVISTNHWKLQNGEYRDLIAQIGSKSIKKDNKRSEPINWRLSQTQNQRVDCAKIGTWVATEAKLQPADNALCKFYLGRGDIRDWNIFGFTSDCDKATASIFRARFPWHQNTRVGKPLEEMTESNETQKLMDLRWLSSRIPDFALTPGSWIKICPPTLLHRCPKCCPKRPHIKWIEQQRSNRTKDGTSLVPYEDVAEAGPYERAIKARPPAFCIKIRTHLENGGVFRELEAGINVQSLAHRAAGLLLTALGKGASNEIRLSWRIATRYTPSEGGNNQKFNLLTNNEGAALPFRFQSLNPISGKTLKLRPDQARSLNWMVSRDCSEVEPFEEHVIEEAHSSQLGWMVEVKAQQPVRIRGGIVADEVGFGKTITMLALVKSQSAQAKTESERSTSGLFVSKATCIIVPHTLVPQWKDEIQMFWPDCKVVFLRNIAALQKATIQDIQNADIVLISLGVINSTIYQERLAQLSASPYPPLLKAPRELEAWLEHASDRLEARSCELRFSKSPALFGSVLLEETGKFEADEVAQSTIPSRRLRGAAFQRQRQRLAIHDERPIDSSSYQPETTGKNAIEIQGFKDITHFGEVSFPVLHMFRFHRKVIDEHTYADACDLVLIKSLKTNVCWMLSGTPLIRDFADVKRLAWSLGVFLGVDDDTTGYTTTDNIKAIRKQRTRFESFEAYRNHHSLEWHEARRRHAQLFLDKFARKNLAEIPKIEQQSFLEPVLLSPYHRLIYTELESQLLSESSKLTTQKNKKAVSHDARRRMIAVLNSCETISEGLLINANVLTSYRLPGVQAPTSVETGGEEEEEEEGSGPVRGGRLFRQQNIRNEMRQQLSTLKNRGGLENMRRLDINYIYIEFEGALVKCLGGMNVCDDLLKSRLYTIFSQICSNLYGDQEATELMQLLMVKYKTQKLRNAEVEMAGDGTTVVENLERDWTGTFENALLDVAAENATKPEIRRGIDNIFEFATTLTSALRALRYASNAYGIQRAFPLSTGRSIDGFIASCGCKVRHIDDLLINCECGHTTCKYCHRNRSGQESCAVPGCNTPVLGINLLNPRVLIVTQETGPIGKIETVIDFVSKLDDGIQILVFAQYDTIAKALQGAFEAAAIKSKYARQTSSSQRVLENFRKARAGDRNWVQVLILNPLDSSAAGHNLTNANVVIFVSPILCEYGEQFNDSYAQAIGRVCRYRQERTVQVHHFICLDTIESRILEEKKGLRMEI